MPSMVFAHIQHRARIPCVCDGVLLGHIFLPRLHWLNISRRMSIIALSIISEALEGAWSGVEGCFAAFFILFLEASGVEPPTLLLPNLLPRPLPDMFVELLIYRRGAI